MRSWKYLGMISVSLFLAIGCGPGKPGSTPPPKSQAVEPPIPVDPSAQKELDTVRRSERD